MKIEEINTISELKTFINKEGIESEILEYKPYNSYKYTKKKDDVLKGICGLANNKGGIFVIGVDDNENIVYTKIDLYDFRDRLDNRINDLIEPKGLKYKVKKISNNNGYCIIIIVETTPATCYAQKIYDAYKFPYRTFGLFYIL